MYFYARNDTDKIPGVKLNESVSKNTFDITSWSFEEYTASNGHKAWIFINRASLLPFIIFNVETYTKDEFIDEFATIINQINNTLCVEKFKSSEYVKFIRNSTIEVFRDDTDFSDVFAMLEANIEHMPDIDEIFKNDEFTALNALFACSSIRRNDTRFKDFLCKDNAVSSYCYKLSNSFVVHAHEDFSKAEIKAQWEPFSKWHELDGKKSMNKSEEKEFMSGVLENNSKMFLQFSDYLTNECKNSPSEIKQKMTYVIDYVFYYLLESLHQTVVYDLTAIQSFFISLAIIRYQKNKEEEFVVDAIKELYEFLNKTGELSKEDLTIIISETNELIELIKLYKTNQHMDFNE